MAIGWGRDTEWDKAQGGEIPKLQEFRKWLVVAIEDHKRGEMMSIAEAIHGQGVFGEVLKKFDDMFHVEQGG